MTSSGRRWLWGFLVATATVAVGAWFVGCGTARPGGDVAGYLEAAERLAERGAPLEPGSDAEQAAVDAFRGLLGDFKAPDFRQRIAAVYAEDVFFNDTLKTVRGRDALVEYLGESADHLEEGTVRFLDLAVKDGDYYFRWEMSLRFKKLDPEQLRRSVGMSHVRFDAAGRVVLHQDFWDASSGFFEHVPVVGWMIRKVKGRL